MVRDMDEAYSALSSENEVTVINPVYEGCGSKYFNAIMKTAKSATSRSDFDMIYDCSNSFRDALEAMRMGAKVIKVTDDYKAYFKVIDIANKYGTKVVTKTKKPMKIKATKNKTNK